MEEKYSFLQILRKGWVVLVIIMLVSIGACLTYSYNFNKDRGFYEFKFSYTEDVDIETDKIISRENIEKTQKITKSYYTSGSISTYSFVEIEDNEISIEKENNIYTILLNVDTLDNLPETANEETVAKGFLKHLVIMGFDDTLYEDFKDSKDRDVKGVTTLFDASTNVMTQFMDNNQRDKMIMWSLIGLGIGLVIGISLVLVLGYKYSDKLKKEDIYDNKTVFRTPFHKAYWKSTCTEMKSVKKMVIIALLLGLTLISKLIPIPSGFGNLGLGLGLVFLSIGGMLFGPVPALMMGATSDILGFFINGSGAFFFGYTIQAMFACFIYGIFFYKTRINFTRALLARVLVNFIANVLIGSISWAIISSLNFQATMDYILAISLPKNIAYLIPQSVLIYIVIRCVAPIAEASDLIEPKIVENATIF